MPKNLFQTTLYRFLFLFVRVKREVLENGRKPTKSATIAVLLGFHYNIQPVLR